MNVSNVVLQLVCHIFFFFTVYIIVLLRINNYYHQLEPPVDGPVEALQFKILTKTNEVTIATSFSILLIVFVKLLKQLSVNLCFWQHNAPNTLSWHT